MVGASYTRKAVKFDDVIPITEQNTRIEQFAKKHKISITKKYSDRKESLDAEEGFLQMKEDAICRKFDCIFVWSFAYFGKNYLTAYNLLRYTFFPVGIGFAVVSDGFISTEKTAIEIETYLDTKYKEYRKANDRECIKNAMAKAPNKHYGYKIDNGVYVIDEKVKPIVESIFSLALEGRTPKEICKYLNDHRIDPPPIYRKKAVGKSVEGISENWNVYMIKRMLSSTKYKGLLRIVCDGQEDVLPIPAYIGEKEYEKLNENKVSIKKAAKWDNPLLRKVFDKTTGISMYSKDYAHTGKRIFFVAKNTEEVEKYKYQSIPADVVFSEVEKAMKKERNAALNALKMVGSSDTGEAEFIKQTEGYRNELEQVFEHMLCRADTGDTSALHMLDKRFSEIQETINFYKVAYSLKNPWLSLYSGMDDNPLSKKKAEKFIDKVLIENNERVELVTFHTKYKDCLPKSWTEVL